MTDLARSFERAAEEYERGRPGTPRRRSTPSASRRDAVVLDLAAGTGKLTRQLVARFARVIAVEPLDGMRAVLERLVPEAEALDGSAEAIPLADEAVDAVFVGEAFHWFATDGDAREIARVLRPGGVLAILFNQWTATSSRRSGGVLGRVPRERDREAAGADRPHRPLARRPSRGRSSR